MISASERAELDGKNAVRLDPLELAPPVRCCVVYSFGINDEWSFEETMANYGCYVFAFVPNGGLRPNAHGDMGNIVVIMMIEKEIKRKSGN